MPGSSYRGWAALRPLLLAALAALSGHDPGPARAQGAADLDPGQVKRRIEETQPKPVQPGPVGPLVPQQPGPEVQAREISLVLSAVLIEGNTVFGAGELAPLYEEFLARSVGRAELDEIARRITEKYRAAGYVLSNAVIPPQEVRGGVLRVIVLEGFIARVAVEGAPSQESAVRGYAERITRDRPTRLATLERYLLLMNDLAGITVRDTRLERIGEGQAGYELTVELAYDALDGLAYLDNRGTPAVGRLQTWLSGGANSLLGTGERLQVGFFTVPDQPRELLYGEVSYQQPLGSEGTLLTARASASRIDAGDALAASDTKARSEQLVLRLEHPLIRSRETSLWARATFDYLNLEEERFGLTTFEDRLRVVRLGLTYAFNDGWDGANLLALELSQGIDAFGASEAGSGGLSRADGDPDFTKVTAELTRTQPLSKRVSLLLGLKGQVAADPLLSAEEFSLGGSQYGRGYDFGELTGEEGVAGIAELRFGETVNADWLAAYQLYGFSDFGAVWNDNVPDELDEQSLASAGVGVRLFLPYALRAGVEVATPLTRPVESTGDDAPRVFFYLSSSF